MIRIRPLVLGPLVLGAAAIGLTACGASTGYSAATSATHTAPRTVAPPATHTAPALAIAATGLGKVVVSGSGRTVYVYDADHQGTTSSACTGACRAAWPPVTFHGTARTRLEVEGVTGKVGSIAVSPGVRQVTLAGWPLYYYAGDAQAGDVGGQASGGTWWVVDAEGTRVTATTAPGTGGSGASGGW